MKKNYNLYNLIGIGRNASEEEILDRMKRIERLKTSYSEELWKKIVGARLVNNLIVKKNLDHNNLNNVCVQYEVKAGDTKNYLDDIFKEYGFSYYEVSGSYRDMNKIYAGDTVIGITTKEKADKLVEEGRGKIISVDEAVELLSENNSLTPELKKYINGKSDVVFYIPTSIQK